MNQIKKILISFGIFSFGLGLGLKIATAQSNEIESILWDLERDYMAKALTADPVGNSVYWHESFLGWPRGNAAPIGVREASADRLGLATGRGDVSAGHEFEEMALRVFDDVAVVHYRVHQQIPQPTVIRIVHFWQETADGWKILGGASALDPALN